MGKVIFGVTTVLFTIIIFALCKASGKADKAFRYSERMELKGHK